MRTDQVQEASALTAAAEKAAVMMDKAKKLLRAAGLTMVDGTISEPFNQVLDELRAALASAPAAQQPAAWPRGWKLVPLKPTQDMLSAMAECDGYLPTDRDRPGLTRWDDYWLMAIAAAPITHGASDAPQVDALTQAATDVLAERRRQVEQEDYRPDQDDGYVNDEIAAYATFYAMPPAARDWPATETGYGETWGEAIIPPDWTPPKPSDRRRELVKAGALILAEIERLDRAAQSTFKGDGK